MNNEPRGKYDPNTWIPIGNDLCVQAKFAAKLNLIQWLNVIWERRKNPEEWDEANITFVLSRLLAWEKSEQDHRRKESYERPPD
jgi:hypothetical protein